MFFTKSEEAFSKSLPSKNKSCFWIAGQSVAYLYNVVKRYIWFGKRGKLFPFVIKLFINPTKITT